MTLLGVGVICLLVVAIAAGAALGVSRRASEPADPPLAAVQPQVEAETVASIAGVGPAAAVEPPAAQSSPVKAPVARTQRKTPAKAPVARALPAEMPTVEAAALMEEPASGFVEASVASAPAADSASSALVLEPGVVTITGCLERNNDGFRLKDTAGVDAPKSRSWRSGFLTRRSVSIDVVDLADRQQLPTYVGQRVSVTGLLLDREMDVRSLQRVAEDCD
jgi:hypothetical protein